MRWRNRLETAVSDQVRSERDLQVANAELLMSSETLREHNEVIGLLGGMAHLNAGSRAPMTSWRK